MTEAGLPELGRLIQAIETADRPRERQSLGSLTEQLHAGGADPARDTLLVRDGAGALVAYAWNLPQHGDVDPRRVVLTGGVHPEHRRTGIGHQLLGWQLEAGRAWDASTRVPGHGPLRHVLRAEIQLSAQQRLAEDFGLEAGRWFSVLTQRFAGPPAAPAPVSGMEIVTLTPDLHERARLAHNAAFADHWGSQPVAAGRWAEHLASVSTRADWCLAARDRVSGEVVGYAVNAAYEAEWPAQGYSAGETNWLGVLRAWRKRGVATALLRRSMQLFHAAGMQGATLGVDSDNPSGAYPLYRALGYRVVGGFVVHTRTDPADQG